MGEKLQFAIGSPGNIIPREYNTMTVLAISLLMVAISVPCAIVFGLKCLIIPAVILLAFLTLANKMFLFYFFLLTTPLAAIIFPKYYIKYSFLLILIFLFCWFTRKMVRPQEGLRLSVPLVAFGIVFMFIVSVSALNFGLTAGEVLSIIKLVIFFLLVFAIYDIYQPRHLFWIMLSASIPMVIISFMLLLNYIKAGGWVAWIGLYRAKGGAFPTNVNALAFVILILSLYWAGVAIWSRRKAVRRLSVFMAVYLTFSLLLTGARASFLGFLLSAFIFSYWAKKLKYLIVICLLGMLILLSIPMFQTLFSVVFRFEGDVSGRDKIWLNTIDMIERHFWFGVGISNYQRSYGWYMDTAAWSSGFHPPSAHNQILDYMAELGILGLPMILILYYLPLKKGIISLRKITSIDDKGVIYGLLGGLIAVYARSIFEGGGMLIRPFLYPSILFWVIFIVFLKIEEMREMPARSVFFGQPSKK